MKTKRPYSAPAIMSEGTVPDPDEASYYRSRRVQCVSLGCAVLLEAGSKELDAAPPAQPGDDVTVT
jgi:hypothetical protein